MAILTEEVGAVPKPDDNTDIKATCYYDLNTAINNGGCFGAKSYEIALMFRGIDCFNEVHKRKLLLFDLNNDIVQVIHDLIGLKATLNAPKYLVMYFACNQELKLSSIFLELCDMSLPKWVKNKNIEIPRLEVLRQVTTGMEWLHYRGILHRSLTSNSIIITRMPVKAKITDIGQIKHDHSKDGFTPSSDVFALGLVYCYVLTDGKPFGAFGKHSTTTNGNVMISDKNIHLIKLMLSKDPQARPSCSDLLSCQMFWCKNPNDCIKPSKPPPQKRAKPPIPKKPTNIPRPKSEIIISSKIGSVKTLVNRFSTSFDNTQQSQTTPLSLHRVNSVRENRRKISDSFLSRINQKASSARENQKSPTKNDENEEQELNLDPPALLQIVRMRNLQIIKKSLEKLSKVMKVTSLWDEKHESFLHVAVKYRDPSVVEYLLNIQGFSSMLSEKPYRNIVHECMWDIHEISHAKFEEKCKVLPLLFSAKQELVDSMDECNRTPLHVACVRPFNDEKQRYQLIEMLIRSNANMNLKGWEDLTPLHFVGKCDFPNNFNIIKLLIDNKAEPDSHFIQLLLDNANRQLFHQILEYLVSVGKERLFKGFGDAKPLLHRAVWHYELLPETLEIFKSLCFNFNAEGFRNETVLQTAFRAGRSAEFLELLISFGADSKSLSSDEFDYIHRAAWLNNLGYVKLLISLGCDVNAKDELQAAPLHSLFAGWTHICRECVRELINHGADVNVKDKNGALPIAHALRCLRIGKTEQATIHLLLNDPL